MDRRTVVLGGIAWALGARAAAAASSPPAFALVTADTEAHVAVVALERRLRVVRRVRTVSDPRSIERSPGGTVAIVGHAGAGAITLLALRPGGDVHARRVVRGFAQPRYTAFAPGGRIAYVTDSGTGEVAVVDVRAGRVVRRVGVGDGARHLGLSPDGRRLWIALGSSAAAIAVMDLRDPWRPRRGATLRPRFLVHDVAFSPSGRRVWVTAGRERRVAILSAFTGAHVLGLVADEAPQHVSLGPTHAYVASGDGASVATHALTDGHVVRRARVPIGSYNIQRTGSTVLTPSLGTGALTLLDRRGGVLASGRVAEHAHDSCGYG